MSVTDSNRSGRTRGEAVGGEKRQRDQLQRHIRAGRDRFNDTFASAGAGRTTHPAPCGQIQRDEIRPRRRIAVVSEQVRRHPARIRATSTTSEQLQRHRTVAPGRRQDRRSLAKVSCIREIMQHKPRLRPDKPMTSRFTGNHLLRSPDCGEILDASDAIRRGSAAPDADPAQFWFQRDARPQRAELRLDAQYSGCTHEDLRFAADTRLRDA